MTKSRLLLTSLLSISLFSQPSAWAQDSNTEKRPPQFILLAFDGSYNKTIWQYSRDYTKHQRQQGIDTRFTFFINPVYLLTPNTKWAYKAPGGNRGSAIGWGDSNTDVSGRVDQMNEAYREGHEIGSHAVGHFDGSGWSKSDWTSEFKQFDYILNNLFSINKLSRTVKGYTELTFLKDIIGFRAPQLGTNKNLYQTLQDYNFKYDTSQVGGESYWPRKNSYGQWNFPLAQIKEPGASRKWLSMDYNFCVRDSSAILARSPETMKLTSYDPNSNKTIKNNARDCLKVLTATQKSQVKENMLKLYRSYFNTNYYGNRAPMHIGHHFSSWMSGAYMEAFFDFATEVCAKPEVKCVTYTELNNFMDQLSDKEISDLQAGNFPKLPRPKSATLARHLDLEIKMVPSQNALKVALAGRDAQRTGLKTILTFKGLSQEVKDRLDLARIRNTAEKGETGVLRFAVVDRLNKELATASFDFKDIGTEQESVGFENLEEKWLQGHLPGSHAEDNVNTFSH